MMAVIAMASAEGTDILLPPRGMELWFALLYGSSRAAH